MRKLSHAKTKAVQCICFCYIDESTIPVSLIQNFKPLTIFCGSTARLETPKTGFLATKLNMKSANSS